MKRLCHALLLFTLSLATAACTEENPIDDYPVSLRLDLTFNDKALRSIPAAATYTRHSHPLNAAYRSFGFGGVLVVHAVDDQFYAFDLSCPYENLSSVLVEPDNDVIYATCPQCGTKYLISDGNGMRVDGVGRHGLKPYRVDRQGNTLLVYN